MSGPTVAATAMVASSQRLATEVGVDILKGGGSAVDAALAVNAMLNLIEPYMCGLGGDLFAQVWDPSDRSLRGLNASGRAPRAQSLADLQHALGGSAAIPIGGIHALTVPGAVAGWAALHAHYGRLSLAEIFAPVVHYAEAGVNIGPATAAWWFHSAGMVTANQKLGALADGFQRTFLIDGRTPTAGARFTNPALGRTYAALAEHGFDDFYRGSVAHALTGYLEDCGCPISGADLAACSAEWVEPISTNYRGYEVYELPPNGQGLSVLQILNLLETFPLADYGYDSVEYWHRLIEAKKLAFEDRAHFFADPDFAAIPVAALAGKDYARARAALIGARANNAPRTGDPLLARGDTTYLSVADGDGMMVSLIQSIYAGFGAGLAPPELGFALQSRGAGFSLDPAHANVYAPGKRPFHTIIPGFVMRDGEPWMSFGVMGADMQPQGQVEVLVNMIDFGMDPQQAGDAPRLRHDGVNGPNLSTPADGGIVRYEAGFDAAILAALTARGHQVQAATLLAEHFMGGYQSIRRDPNGWCGASEIRFDGCASGY